MKARLEKLKRIERMQRRLHDLSRWKLTVLARERDQLVQTHEEMLVAISEGLLAFGGAAAAGTRRIRGLEVDLSAARVLHDAEAKRVVEVATRSRLADLVVEAATARYRAMNERKSLEDLIALTIASANPVPRKP